MKRENGKLNFSPSDLTRFIESEFITWMDRYDLEYPGEIERDEDDETARLLQRRGIQHEKDFLARLEKEGRDIVDISSFTGFFFPGIDL